MRDLYGFLGVDETFHADAGRAYNRSGPPRSRILHRLLTKPNLVRRMLKYSLPEPWRTQLRVQLTGGNTRKPNLDAEIQAHMRQDYREDTLRVQDLLQRDLSAWL